VRSQRHLMRTAAEARAAAGQARTAETKTMAPNEQAGSPAAD